jgi:nitroreductase
MELFEAIKGRCSVRKWQHREVPDEAIERLIDAARHAPSSKDSQPWEFVVVRDSAVKQRFALTREESNRAEATAPVLIVICADTKRSESRWIEDCSVAAQNLLLAAHAMGLGAVWLTGYKHPIEPGKSETERTIVRELALPAHIRPACVIALGYPDEAPEPKRLRNIREMVHRERW